jgi:hypothetical protein
MCDSFGYLFVWTVAHLYRLGNIQKRKQLCQSPLPIGDLLHRQQFQPGGCMRTSQDYQRCPAIVSYVLKEVPCAHVRSSYFRSWTASVVGRIGAPMPSTRTAQTGSATASDVVRCTHICTTCKCNKCSCNDRHETAVLSDPVVIHDHCSLGVMLISRPHGVEGEKIEDPI